MLRRRFSIAVAVAFLAGCAALRPAPPEVSLAAVRVVELGLVEQRLVLVLRVRNPGPRDFVVSGLAYEAELGGKPFARGVSNRRAVIAGYGESLLEVPATARLSGLLEGLLGGLDALLDGRTGAGELDYRVHGTIELEGFGSRPFDRSGKVRLAPERKPTPLPEGART